MSRKPVLIFFKMFNCGHCTQFAENPTPESSPWAELLRDKELQNTVDFVRYDFGIETKAGQTVRHKLPEQYSFVNYGPYFYLHQPGEVENGLEFTQAEAQKYTRSAKGLKTWIKDKLQKDPKFAQARRAPPATTPQAPIVARPAAQPVPQAPEQTKSPSSGFQSYKPTIRPAQEPPATPPAAPSPVLVPNPAAKVRNSRTAVKVPAQVEEPPLAIRARNRRRR